jgi:hypothetical protein
MCNIGNFLFATFGFLLSGLLLPQHVGPADSVLYMFRCRYYLTELNYSLILCYTHPLSCLPRIDLKLKFLKKHYVACSC